VEVVEAVGHQEAIVEAEAAAVANNLQEEPAVEGAVVVEEEAR